MNQSQFEQKYQQQWQQFSEILSSLEQNGKGQQKGVDLHSFPEQYRIICNHYSLAQSRHYSPALVDSLHEMVLRGHRQLYKKKGGLVRGVLLFIFREFPQTVRQQARYFWLAFFLFYGPAMAIGIAAYNDPVFIYSVMSENQVSQMENMYSADEHGLAFRGERGSETDFQMFGFYIYNNISIGFRTFAGGMIFGAGTIFFLIYNGIMIGGAAGHLSHPPFAEMFWQFVPGHGAYELTAVVISGAAGLILGYSILKPGKYKRSHSLKQKAPTALKLVMGAAFFLLIAAFIEAFWSSSTLPVHIKYWFAGANWLLVTLYLVFGGRRTK